MYQLVIPFPATGKGRPRYGKGKAYTPPPTRAFEQLIKIHARCIKPLEGPVELSIVATYKKPPSWSKAKREANWWKTSTPDADNIGKLVADALNGIAWNDDRQIASLHVQKIYGACDSIQININSLPPSKEAMAQHLCINAPALGLTSHAEA